MRNFILSTLLLSASTLSIAAGVPTAVPTYHSIGVYWPSLAAPLNGADGCQVQYRVKGSSTWKRGLDLWYDSRNTECRGSLVNLTPATEYEIKVSLDGISQTLSSSTWKTFKPILKTMTLPELSNKTLTITESGTENGYVVYQPAAGKSAVIDVKKLADFNIIVNAKYVIIRGLTLKGAKHSGILLGANASDNSSDVTDVIIENNDISAWGENATNPASCAGQPVYGKNTQSAVYSRSKLLSRITVQRNKLHHPSTDSNNWKEHNCAAGTSHPTGPQGVSFFKSQGNIVVRYNEIYSDDAHQFNDSMGEYANFSDGGFPNKDSDIYSNHISNTWDDGIESEGANKNVRIWGNYIEKTYIVLGLAATYRGPLYAWKNVSGQSRTSHTANYGQGFIKTRSKSFGGGRVYLFHNTVTKPVSGDSTSSFLNEYSATDGISNYRTLNNIMQVNEPTKKYSISDPSGTNNAFDYDLLGGLTRFSMPQEANGKKGTPTFVLGAGFNTTTKKGKFSLEDTSLGFDDGKVIPNFNDGFSGSAPDMGAHEAGKPDMEFGVNAYFETPPLPPSTNILANGDFEQSLTGWASPSGTSIISTGQYAGLKGLQLKNSNSLYVSQAVTTKLVIGAKYRLRGFARVTNGTTGAELVAKVFDANNNALIRAAVPVIGSVYKEYSVEFTVPAKMSRATVYGVKSAGLQIPQFDNLVLERISP